MKTAGSRMGGEGRGRGWDAVARVRAQRRGMKLGLLVGGEVEIRFSEFSILKRGSRPVFTFTAPIPLAAVALSNQSVSLPAG